MFYFRVTNLGTANETGNRALLEYHKSNAPLCAIVRRIYGNLETGVKNTETAFVLAIFKDMLSTVTELPGWEAAVKKAETGCIALERDSKGFIASPKRHHRPITFAEKVDEISIADEFCSIAQHESKGKALVAWMKAQHEYKEIQLLAMHCIQNAALVLNGELAIELLLRGDSSRVPIEYLYEFDGEDAIFAQEFCVEFEALEAAGASEDFVSRATLQVNAEDEDNVVACISTAASIDLTYDTTTKLKQLLTPFEVQCKPLRFTATFFPESQKGVDRKPPTAVVNAHFKFIKNANYEETFASVVKKLFEAVENALCVNHIFDNVCVLLVADSNLQTMESAKKAASLLGKDSFEMFNHTVVMDLDGKHKESARKPRNTLVNNVNRDRRFSIMSTQWAKTGEDMPRTLAPKGVVVAKKNTPFCVQATCITRDTPSYEYKLDHGHIMVKVTEKKMSSSNWYVAALVVATFVILMAFVISK